jgi:hypothetical protein
VVLGGDKVSKYDEERKKILARMQQSNVSFEPESKKKSKYADEREKLYNPVQPQIDPTSRVRPELRPESFVFQQPKPVMTPAPIKEQPKVETSKPKEAELPGRNIPIVGPVLKGLDWLADKTKPASDIAQQLYVPGAGLGNIGSFAGAVESGIARVAPKLALSTNIGARIGRGAITEAVTGVPVGAGQVLATNPNATGKQVAEGAAFGGALGVAGGAASPVVAKGLGTALGRLFKRNGLPEEQAQEILALPLGREDAARANALARTRTQTPDVVYNADTRPPEPLGLPSPRIAPPTTARVAQQTNPYRQQFEALINRAQQLQQEGRFTPGREDADLESLWAQMAGREAPSLDELINLAYKPRPSRVTPNLASQARSYQAAREVAGAPLPVKAMAERYNAGPVAQAAAPIERIGRAPGMQPLRREPDILPASVEPPKPRMNITSEPDIIQATPEPRIRDRVYARLDDMEKAARQRINSRRGRLSANPLDEWADHAIIMAAKTGKGTIKAADFTEELVREFGESIRPHASTILRKTREVLRTQERLASKEGQDASAFNAGEGDANTFIQKISNEPGKKKRSLSEITQKARSQFSDDFAALEGLEKDIRGRVSSAEDSLYKSARNIRGLPAKALQTVQQRLTPIANDVEKAGYSMDDLGAYALAKHAQDVNTAGYKSGFTDKEIADVLRKYGTPEMEAIRKKLIQINDDMLQQLTDSGVVSKDLAETLRERWPNYVPLFRALDDEAVGFEGGLSKALANVASPIKMLKGSEKRVINPLENMVKNIFQSTSAAERNKVGMQLARLADEDPSETFIRRLGPDEEVGRKNVVNVKVEGQNVKYEVQPEVYKALLNMDQESSNMLIKALQAPASLLRSGATLTPEFSLRNPMRDVIQAFIVSNSGFNPLIDFPVGLIQTIKKGDLYKQWVDNLGDFGNTVSMDRNTHKEALKKVLGEKNSKKFVNIVTGKSLLRLLRAITDTTESATKVGEFRAALRKGASPQEAAYRARDIMDFGRAGSSIRQTNKVIAFLNANIQGKSKLIRAAKADPVGVATRAFTAVTLPTIAAFIMKKYLANDTQRQTIDESPDWLKDSFWLVPVPGTDVVARIPKPFDLAPIFANLPEKALQFTYDKDKSAFDGFARRSLASYAIPMQITGLLPLVEGMANYSFFREGQIIPQREEGLEHKDQYDPVRTTEIAKILAAGADAVTGGKGPFKNFGSPRIMDNTISGLTAGLGSYVTSAVDSILQGKVPFTGFKVGPNLVNRPEAPSKRLEQQPLAKAFLVDPLQSTKSMDKLYTRKAQLTTEKSSANLNDKKFDKDKAMELKGLDRTADKLSKINKEIRTIESDQSLNSKQKREQIEVLLKQRNDLVGSAMK